MAHALPALQEEFDDGFYMYRAKIAPCPRQDVHSYSSCPYLHPNEQAQRRDPRVFRYDSIFCYDLHNTKMCRRGTNCPYSHNLFEYFLHPSRYRTRMCEYGADCRRELCFFAHNETELRQRTAIKVHSGGRRSSRQHFPATAAHGAGAGAGADSDSSAGSPSVRILQMPRLPFTDGSSGSPVHLDLGGTGALTRLNLAGAGAPACSLGSTPPQHGALGMQLQPQQQSSSVLILQQQTSVSCAADMMAPLSFDTGLGMQGMHTLSSSSMVSTTQCMLPVNYVDMPMSCPQMTIQANSQGLMPAFVFDSGSQGTNWGTGLPAQQQLLQVPRQQQLLQPLQQGPMMQAPQMQLVSHAQASVMPATSFGFSSQPASTLQAIDANSGNQYMLVPVIGSNNMGGNSPAFQAQQTISVAPAGMVQHGMPAPVPDQPVLLVVNTLQQQ